MFGLFQKKTAKTAEDRLTGLEKKKDWAELSKAYYELGVAAMEQAISDFWWATPMDELLGMTEEDIVVRFNAWAADCGTDHVSFCHVTGDHVHYECADERGHHDEVHHAEEHHSGHHS